MMKKYTGNLEDGMPIEAPCGRGFYNSDYKNLVKKVYHDNEWKEYAPLQPEVKQMCFIPAVGDICKRIVFRGQCKAWYGESVWRMDYDKDDYSTPCLRPEYAADIVEVLNVLWKAKAAKGALRSCDLRDYECYFFIGSYGGVEKYSHNIETCWGIHGLFPPFDTIRNCQAFIDSVGGGEAIKNIMRKWHGNH